MMLLLLASIFLLIALSNFLLLLKLNKIECDVEKNRAKANTIIRRLNYPKDD